MLADFTFFNRERIESAVLAILRKEQKGEPLTEDDKKFVEWGDPSGNIRKNFAMRG